MEANVVEKNELVVVVDQSGLEQETAKTLLENFTPLFKQANEWKEKASKLVVTDASQTRLMQECRVARLALKDIRISADKTRKALKEDSLRYGKAVQGVYNVIEYLIAPIESHLQEQEDFAKVQEQKRKEALKVEREEKLAPFGIETSFYDLGGMTEPAFVQLYDSCVAARDKKIEEDRKAEEERIAKEQAAIIKDMRIKMLLNIGAKEVGETIFLKNTENPDFSNVINIEGIESIEDNQFSIYMEEFLTTASENEKYSAFIESENKRLSEEKERLEKEVAAKNQLRLERNAVLNKYGYLHESDTAELTEAEFEAIEFEQRNVFEDAEKKRIEAEQEEELAKEQRARELFEERERIKNSAKQELIAIGFIQKEDGLHNAEVNHFIGENHFDFDTEAEATGLVERTRLSVEKQRLEKELKERQDKEAKELADKQAAEELEAAKGDKAKFQDLINELQAIISNPKYSFKSKKFKTAYAGCVDLLNKVINFLISKQ